MIEDTYSAADATALDISALMQLRVWRIFPMALRVMTQSWWGAPPIA
jgi:hypothetical protein